MFARSEMPLPDPWGDNSISRCDRNPIASVWWAPDRGEQLAGRDYDDPDIFSWQIPHLKFTGKSCSNPPKSWKTLGAATDVYFANLTNATINVKRVAADGKQKWVAGVGWWSELQSQSSQVPTQDPGSPLYFVGANSFIEYGADSDGIRRVDAAVGESFVVRKKSGECVGTYRVVKPPSYTITPYHVAEIHEHKSGNSKSGVLDRD